VIVYKKYCYHLKFFRLLSFISFVTLLENCVPNTDIIIKVGVQPQIDGIIKAGEWSDANYSEIEIEEDWVVRVYYKQDSSNLYVRFSNLVINDSTELYPEVLIDVANNKSTTLDSNDWWFHCSYSNCDGNGEVNNYESCKSGTKDGWIGNNFPLEVPGELEIMISKKLLAINGESIIGIAFDVTDTHDRYYFYPPNARLYFPATWTNGSL